MITIQNGKLHIPDEDRFVGFAGDNTVIEKQFVLIDRVQDGCAFTLCLRFDDDTLRSVPLSAAFGEDSTVLTWTVQAEQLHASGIAAAQLRIAGGDGDIAHTTKDYFLIGAALEQEDGVEEYVTPSMLRNSINQAMSEIASTAPYVDADGYWCVYDPDTGSYRRTNYHVSGIAPDSAMSGSSDNAVANRVIKQYVDAKVNDANLFARSYTDLCVSDKVPQTRAIASLPLSADIGASDLAAAIRPYTYRTGVMPNMTPGVKGQMGVGVNGEVYFCKDTDTWQLLVGYESLYEKMDLIAEVAPGETESVDDGNLFFCGSALYAKRSGSDVAIAKANDVYTKAEIDTMIGSVESLLAAI